MQPIFFRERRNGLFDAYGVEQRDRISSSSCDCRRADRQRLPSYRQVGAL
jgi:hypothetical protein